MPIAKIQLPDGRIAKIEVPEGATESDVMAFIAQNHESFARQNNDSNNDESQPRVSSNPRVQQRVKLKRKSDQETIDRENQLSDLEKTNPFLAQMLRDMSPAETALVSAGSGFSDIISALPFTEDKSEEDRARDDMLTLVNPRSAAVGKTIGQSAPFAGASVLGAGVKAGLVGRSAIQGAIGATEGGLIAKSSGADQAGILKGAAIGGAIGGGAEVVGSGINRAARSLVSKIKGAPPSGRLIDDAGQPTAELNDALSKSGKSFDELKEEASSKSTENLTESFAKAGQSGRLSEVIDQVETDPSRITAAKELGFNVEDVPVGVLTKNQAAQELFGAMAAVPVSKASSEFDFFVNNLSQRADEYIEEIGGALDKTAIGDDVLKSMQSDISRIKVIEDTLYNDIRGAIGEGTLINVKPVKNLLSARARTRRGIKNLSPVERDVYSMIKDGKVTYANLDDKIRKIGAAIGRETDAYSTTELSKLSDMYSNLKRLREGVAKQFGKDQRLQRANKLSSKRFGIQEATKNLFGKDLGRSMFPKIDQNISNLGTGQAKEFIAIMENIPKSHRGTVIATALNRAMVGGKDSAQSLNATQFSKWLKNLKRNQASYDALKKYAPEGSIKRLEALGELSNGVSSVKASRVRTGIVPDTLKRYDDVNGLIDKLYRTGQSLEQSPVGSAVARPVILAGNIGKMFTLKKTPAVESIDSLINSKEFKRAFIEASKSGVESSKYKAASAALKSSKTYKEYLKTLDSQTASGIAAAGLIPWLTKEEEEN